MSRGRHGGSDGVHKGAAGARLRGALRPTKSRLSTATRRRALRRCKHRPPPLFPFFVASSMSLRLRQATPAAPPPRPATTSPQCDPPLRFWHPGRPPSSMSPRLWPAALALVVKDYPSATRHLSRASWRPSPSHLTCLPSSPTGPLIHHPLRLTALLARRPRFLPAIHIPHIAPFASPSPLPSATGDTTPFIHPSLGLPRETRKLPVFTSTTRNKPAFLHLPAPTHTHIPPNCPSLFSQSASICRHPGSQEGGRHELNCKGE